MSWLGVFFTLLSVSCFMMIGVVYCCWVIKTKMNKEYDKNLRVRNGKL